MVGESSSIQKYTTNAYVTKVIKESFHSHRYLCMCHKSIPVIQTNILIKTLITILFNIFTLVAENFISVHFKFGICFVFCDISLIRNNFFHSHSIFHVYLFLFTCIYLFINSYSFVLYWICITGVSPAPANSTYSIYPDRY